MSEMRVSSIVVAALAVVIAIGASVLAINQAWAISGSISVGSETADVADEATIEVTADVPDEPGLGAWTVDVIIEDADLVTVLSCDVPAHSVCNPHFATDPPTVRYAGAVAEGLVGETLLGTFSFRCENDGSTVLDISTTGFADGTLGGPQEITATHNLGAITCMEAADDAPTPTPGAEDGADLPQAGTGAFGEAGVLGRVMASLAAAGLAGVVIALAMRRLGIGHR